MPIPVEQDSIVRMTAKERVFKKLQQWIIEGTMVPEERLNDVEIAKYFNVSRTPVREAIQMLSEQNLVHVVPSSGTFVTAIDKNDMKHVYTLLGGLQTFAAELSIDKITEDNLKELEKINESFYYLSENGTPYEAMEADGKFHAQIAEFSENPYLINYTAQLMAQGHRNEIRFFETHPHSRKSFDDHRDIINALREKDAEKAGKLLRENWSMSVDYDDM